MYKYLISLMLIVCSGSSNAQAPLKYDSVYNVNVDKEQIYTAARAWFSQNIKDMKSAIDIQDKEAGEIIGKFSIPYKSKLKGNGCSRGRIEGHITILVKDNKYRIIITDFKHIPDPDWTVCSITYDFNPITDEAEPPFRVKRGWGRKWEINTWNELKTNIDVTVTNIQSSLLTKIQNSQKDEW